jgi:hypothetical protein
MSIYKETDKEVKMGCWLGKIDNMYSMIGKDGKLTSLDHYIKLRLAIRSTDQDKVNIAKVAIKLIEGKRWE